MARPLDVIADRDRWASCNLRTTSLMEANATWGRSLRPFLAGEQLASAVAAIDEGEWGSQSTIWRRGHFMTATTMDQTDGTWSITTRVIVYAAIGAALYAVFNWISFGFILPGTAK